MKKIIPLLTAVVMLASACGEYANTESAQLGCVFNGGMLDSKDFREFTAPGDGRERVGYGSEVIEVPLRLLTYEISKDITRGDTPTADSLKVNVGGMQMEFEPTVAMRFNTKIETVNDKAKPKVCELVEVHLKPFDATDFNETGGVWQYSWLASRFRPWVDTAGVRAIQASADPVALYFNIDGARDAAADQLGEELSKELTAALGDEYFCGPDHEFVNITSDDSDDASCGNVRVTLPQPIVAEEDLNILKAPQRARTEADAAIAQANEKARQAKQVADARAVEAESAKTKADADVKIAEEAARTIEVTTSQNYEWCRVLRELGESCWLVKAAETGGLPNVLGEQGETSILVPAEVGP